MFQKNFLSIDIGNQNIKIACGKVNKNKVYIDKLIMTETPLYCIEDGNIIDKIKLADAIKEAVDMSGIKTKDIIFTTNSTDIINREIIVPNAEDEELDTVVQFELQQYLPIVMDDYIVQYNILDKVRNEDTEAITDKLKMLVVTYPKRMVEQYLKLAEELKLKAGALDVNFNATSKLFKNDVLINEEVFTVKETAAVIDMGAEKININIFCNGKMDFSRNITDGGIVIDRNIARNLDKNLDEAEKLKKGFCDLMDEKEKEQMKELNTVIKKTVDNWIDEIGRVFQFYRNKKVGNTINKVYIYGGTSKLEGLSKYMEKTLNISVSNINSMSNIVLSKNVIKENMDCFLNCIGALIRL